MSVNINKREIDNDTSGSYGNPEDIFDFIQEHRKSFVGKRLLLAEGKEVNREIVRKVLQNQGFIVDTVNDKLELVNKLGGGMQDSAPDYSAVLLDDQLPESEGIKAAVHVPVVRLTKPVDIPIMLATLVQYV